MMIPGIYRCVNTEKMDKKLLRWYRKKMGVVFFSIILQKARAVTMSKIRIILPAVLPESGRWLKKRLIMRRETGTFPTQPFVGIMPAHGGQLFPVVGPGFIWCDSNNRHNKKLFPFMADPAVGPPISVTRLLRAHSVLQQIELIDLLHKRPNTFGDCWEIANVDISLERKSILQDRFGSEAFSLLIEGVKRYRSEDHEGERNILCESLWSYNVSFVD